MAESHLDGANHHATKTDPTNASESLTTNFSWLRAESCVDLWVLSLEETIIRIRVRPTVRPSIRPSKYSYLIGTFDRHSRCIATTIDNSAKEATNIFWLVYDRVLARRQAGSLELWRPRAALGLVITTSLAGEPFVFSVAAAQSPYGP